MHLRHPLDTIYWLSYRYNSVIAVSIRHGPYTFNKKKETLSRISFKQLIFVKFDGRAQPSLEENLHCG